jgi:hypothetical protein
VIDEENVLLGTDPPDDGIKSSLAAWLEIVEEPIRESTF